MSSQGTRKNRQGELERPLGAGPTPQANGEVLLAELKRLLEFSGHPPFAPSPSPAPPLSASTVFASASTAAKPRQSTDFDKTDSADDLSADGSLKRSQANPSDTYGQHQELTREVTRPRSRRWKLVGFGARIGLRGSGRRGPRPHAANSRAEEPTLRCPNAGAKRCPATRWEVRCSLRRSWRPAHNRRPSA